MKDRIKQIRKEAGLTQEAFAQRLGIKRNTVATYETTNKIPMDSIINSICREFSINEEWLKNGQGDMYSFSDSDDEFIAAIEDIGVKDPMAREIIINYWHLGTAEREQFWSVLNKLLKKAEGDL